MSRYGIMTVTKDCVKIINTFDSLEKAQENLESFSWKGDFPYAYVSILDREFLQEIKRYTREEWEIDLEVELAHDLKVNSAFAHGKIPSKH